jgi:hypothetical protein
MKKDVMLALSFAAVCTAQELVFTNQTITVRPEQLTVESVEFIAASFVTNTVYRWVDVEMVTTNGFLEGEGVVTNIVQEQIGEEMVTTNASHWVCNVVFSLPAGHQWNLNGFPVTVDRFKTRIRVPVPHGLVTDTFGAAATGLEFAAANGAYTPQGQVKDAFVGFAAAALQTSIGGVEE